MITEKAATGYIDEKYEFSAPQYFDFSAGETPEDAAEAERWFFTAQSYLPSPYVAKSRSLLESKGFASFKETYNEVRKLLARFSFQDGESSLSGSSGTSSEIDVSGDAKNSSKSREAVSLPPTAGSKHMDANLSDCAYISTMLDCPPVSLSSEPITENLAAIVLVSSGKKEQIPSSALVNDASCEKIEESASVSTNAISSQKAKESSALVNDSSCDKIKESASASVNVISSEKTEELSAPVNDSLCEKIEESASVSANVISSQKAEENSSSCASFYVPGTEDCQAHPAEANVPQLIGVPSEQNEDKLLLAVRQSWWGEIIWEYIHVLFSQWLQYFRQPWWGEIIWEHIHVVFSQWLLYFSSLVLGSLVEGHNSTDKSDKEAMLDDAIVCEPIQKVKSVDFSTPKCENASGYSERSSNTHGRVLAKRDYVEVERHGPQRRRHAQLKKIKHAQTRYHRKTEMAVAIERSYANKRQKLEGGQARQVCNSRRSIHPSKAMPTLTIPQEFHFQTEERFQSHRGAYCQSFSQVRSPVSPYVPLAERVFRFQFKASERFHRRSDNQALKLTRPKEPDLVTSQRARPPRVKSTAEIEEELVANMPKFKARPLNKKILEGPTLAALPRSMPQLPEFQEFNLRTAERAFQHPSTFHKLASGSDIKFVSELDRHSSVMGGRFSAPCGPNVFTTLHAQSIKVGSLEGMAGSGPAKVSQHSSYSSDKKLMSCSTKERQPVTKEMPKIDENRVSEAQSLFLRENMTVPERTRKPLANIQCSCLPLGASGIQVESKVKNIGPTLALWKEKAIQNQPCQPSQAHAHSLQHKDSVVQMKAIIPMPDSRTLSSTSISRQMR